MSLPVTLKTPAANANTAASAAAGGSGKENAGAGGGGGTAPVSQNIAAVVNLPRGAKPEVLSRSGNDAILRVGGSVMSVSGLKQDLQTVQRHIGFERERRLDAEKQFASESESLLDKEQAEAVQRREEDLARLKDERMAMIEFLKRGSDEAKRISAEVTNLKTRANEKELTENDLQQERQHLESVLVKLEHELDEHQQQQKNLDRKKDEMEQRNAELNALSVSTEQQTHDLEVKLEVLRVEFNQKQISARRVEAVESGMSVISAASRRLLHELEHINTNVIKISDERIAQATNPTAAAAAAGAETGKSIDEELEAATHAPEFDSEVEAEDTRIASVVGATARTKFARSSSLVKAMLTAMTRYDMEIAARLVKSKKQHEADMQGVHKYLHDTRDQCEKELSQWEAKYRQREDQLRKANLFRNKAVSDSLKQHEAALEEQGSGSVANNKNTTNILAAEKALLESSFSLTDYFERIMKDTKSELDQVRTEHQKLKLKVGVYAKDYQLVKDLRQQFREMETQKISMESTLRAAEEENRELKMLMGNQNPTGEEQQQQSAAAIGRRRMSSRRPWKSNAF